ncbi:hypothetical protein HHI36_008121 [Cryptolaemus montrouzieri]|uniref:Transposase n=1 Tax=Cryptolaemus montrouzieri TaxID=559131 RepID=A0ABD2MRP8_9CUCU
MESVISIENGCRQYPYPGIPSLKVFSSVVIYARQQMIDNIIEAVEICPRISACHSARNVGMSKSSVRRTLKKEYFFSYNFQKLQSLEPGIIFSRCESCRCVVDHRRDSARVLFTDYAQFTRDGVIPKLLCLGMQEPLPYQHVNVRQNVSRFSIECAPNFTDQHQYQDQGHDFPSRWYPTALSQ